MKTDYSLVSARLKVRGDSLMRKSILFILFGFILLVAPEGRAGSGQAGGVPSAVLLSVGFGERFNDERFINFNGLGVIGFVDIFSNDIWLSGGLYTNLTFIGDLIDKDEERPKVDGARDVSPEGWGVGPGLALGFTIGTIPYVDVYLLGTIGPSFAVLTRYQIQDINGESRRVKVDELDVQIGYDYGGLFALAYTGSDPWLRGLTLGIEGAFHENTFNRWHLGFVVGFSF